MNGLRLALSFLTTLPLLSMRHGYEANQWRRAALWFPIVGAIVGGVVWLAGWGAQQLYAGWLAAVVAVATWVIITGGLHLDGLADCCDGLLAAVAPQQRLEIMRDPRVGAFGAIGLILYCGLKVGAVQEALVAENGVAIVAAAVLGRTSILWMARGPAARREGMGVLFASQVGPGVVLLGTLPVVVALLLYGWRGGLALVAAVLTSAGLIRFARRRIGGVSGDVYGLSVELVELAVLLVLTAQLKG